MSADHIPHTRTSRSIQTMLRLPRLSADEERELAHRAKQGDATARARLVEGSVSHAVQLAGTYSRYRVPFDELVSAALEGLMRAADKYDPERQCRFFTYASHWCRAMVYDHIIRNWSIVSGGNGSTQSRVFFRLRRERSKLQAILGRTDSEEAEAVAASIAASTGATRARVAALEVRLTAQDVSLESIRISEDAGPEPFRDALMHPGMGPEELLDLERWQVRTAVRVHEAMCFARLSDRERYVLRVRHMCEPEDRVTLESIGIRFGVSRERVRQIESAALHKMRRVLRYEDPSRAA